MRHWIPTVGGLGLLAALTAAAPRPLPTGNPWFPLEVGTKWIYEAETDDGLVHDEITVTSTTKVIQGVTCKEVLDQEWLDGVLFESTQDWYFEDAGGNVWYYGEASTQYDENGNVIGTEGSWEAGMDGAVAGILMPASPVRGRAYYQEYLEDVAEDQAKALRLNASVAVPYGTYAKTCLETKEWSRLEPGAVEHKFYEPGLGLVLVEEFQGGPTERLELIDVQQAP